MELYFKCCESWILKKWNMRYCCCSIGYEKNVKHFLLSLDHHRACHRPLWVVSSKKNDPRVNLAVDPHQAVILENAVESAGKHGCFLCPKYVSYSCSLFQWGENVSHSHWSTKSSIAKTHPLPFWQGRSMKNSFWFPYWSKWLWVILYG